MKKDEREILTRQSVSQKLIYEAKRSIFTNLFCVFIEILLFGMFYLVLSFADASLVIRILRITALISMVLCFTGCAVSVVRSILNICKTRRGDFTVFQDGLTEIKMDKINFSRYFFKLIYLLICGGLFRFFLDRSHYQHIFQFQSGRTFIANAEEYKNTRLGTAAEFSLPGDTFFLVFYNDNPNKVILLFSAKIYAYKAEK